MTTPAIRSALEAYERAWNDLFDQCCSNPVRDFRGHEISMFALNRAHYLAEQALREPEQDAPTQPRQCLPPGWSVERCSGVTILNGPNNRTALYAGDTQTIEGNTLRRLCNDVLAHRPRPQEWRVGTTVGGNITLLGPRGVYAEVNPSSTPEGLHQWQTQQEAAVRTLKRLGYTYQDGEYAPPDAQPVPAATAERADAALGLVELPPIRVDADVALYLKAQAHNRGVIVQAHVRDLLTAVHASNAPARPADAEMAPDVQDSAQHTDTSAWQAHSRSVSDEVLAERLRQVSEEDYQPEHDDDPDHEGALERAAAAYTLANFTLESLSGQAMPAAWRIWPWDREDFKPEDRRRNLVRAAALLLAAIERCDRLVEQAQRGA